MERKVAKFVTMLRKDVHVRNGDVFTTYFSFDCDSVGVVYMIRCRKCQEI